MNSSELEATLNGGVHGVVGGAFDARTEHGARLVLGELVKNFVEFGVGAHVRLVTHLLAHRPRRAPLWIRSWRCRRDRRARPESQKCAQTC